MTEPTFRYIRKNLDEILILGSLARIASGHADALMEIDVAVLNALRRAYPSLEDASLQEIGDYLAGMDEDQIIGFASNLKGVLHEMEFVALENDDGDGIYASLFPATNHRNSDVILVYESKPETVELQLKGTESEA